MELLLREALIQAVFEERSSQYEGHPDKLLLEVREEIEDTLKLRLNKIVEQLLKRKLVDPSDAGQILDFYQEVRHPFLHAIIGRLDKKYSYRGALRAMLPGPITLMDFDEMIEETALTHLDTVARFLEKYA